MTISFSSWPNENGCERPENKGKQTMIKEAPIQAGKAVTPSELATLLSPIPRSALFLASSHADTGSWTGNFWDGDSIDD